MDEKTVFCFKTAINTGLKYGRIDVVGVRDIGGDLSGEIETISIEVKRGSEPFATACGQALGYKIYANRVYLADVTKSFSYDEIRIANNMGIGLVQIKNNRCREILSSPTYAPMPSMNLRLLEHLALILTSREVFRMNISMNLRLLEHLALGKCQICGSFFETGKIKGTKKDIICHIYHAKI